MMKRGILFVSTILILSLAACGGQSNIARKGAAEATSKHTFASLECDYCCYMVSIDEDSVCFKPMEYIGRDDTERIEALGLVEEVDYPSGYCIWDYGSEVVEYPFAEDVEFVFVDWNRDYSNDSLTEAKAEYKDLITYDELSRCVTRDVGIFRERLGNFAEVPMERRTPFFIVMENGYVKQIFEIWMA